MMSEMLQLMPSPFISPRHAARCRRHAAVAPLL